jgi:formylglycine-generating enzyme required for sulfatase activity
MALQEQVNAKEMVQIDAGEFLMGDDEGSREEMPQRTVLLNGFLIDKHPVTNQEYKMFVDVAGHRRPPHWASGTYALEQADHPVTNISWPDAKAFCDWVGKRLPTEGEWEKATVGQTYPWGGCLPKG